MRVLFDTNVVLDLLLDRAPFADDVAWLAGCVERGEIEGLLCATTLTTIHYLTTKALGHAAAQVYIDALLGLFTVASVNRAVLDDAQRSGFGDFEDAVLHAAAVHAGATHIVTRNDIDFRKARLPVVTPAELVALIATLDR